MIRLVRLYFSYFFLWVAFFMIARFIFLFYHFNQTQLIGFQNFIKTFLYGLRLDLSTAGYFSVLFFSFFALSEIFVGVKKYFLFFLKTITYVLIVVASGLIIADLELYKNWGFRLDDTFLKYLKSPQEMTASVSSSPILLLIILSGVFSVFSIFIFNKIIFIPLSKNEKNQTSQFAIKSLKLITGLFLTVSLILPIRGGFQLAPINQSAVYFSNQPFINHAAVNCIWNFIVTVFEKSSDSKNPFIYFHENEALTILSKSHIDTSATQFLLKKDIKKPNIIIVTWESLTAKALASLGGHKGVTPQLDSLCREGILFKNIFATGDRTHLGLMGVLGGQPALPGYNILEIPRKSAQLPILSRNFKENGYQTGFYYGGEAEFANMKSYLLNGQFTTLVTKENFDKKDLSSKWGAFDHVVFEKALRDIPQYQQPFFINILTLSSHEPFEVPEGWGKPNFQKSDNEDELFKNVMFYSDQAFGIFIKNLKQSPLWENTLVIVVADHSTRRLEPHDDTFENFHIPMLWLGGALSQTGIEIDAVGAQTDIAATLLAQLNLPRAEYQWSNNILSKKQAKYAYFTTRGLIGLVKKDNRFVWDTEGGYFRTQAGAVDSTDLNLAKAIQQVSFEGYFK